MHIKEKKVSRYMAPFISSRTGRVAHRGFSTKIQAYKFLAKQMIYDEVFGVKEEFFNTIYPGECVSYWARPKAHGLSKKEWGAEMSKRFHHNTGTDHWGEPDECDCPDSWGYCAEAFGREVTRLAAQLMKDDNND